MLFLGYLEMARVTGQFLPLKCVRPKVRFVLETDLFGKLNFSWCNLFSRVTPRAKTGTIFDNRADRLRSVRIVQISSQMAQTFHLGFETVFFTWQEVTIDAFGLSAIRAVERVVITVLPCVVLFGHRVAGSAAKI